jgi:hypothetical protein
MMDGVLIFDPGEAIMPASYFLQNAENCDELAAQVRGPERKRLERLASGWRAVAEDQDWLDGHMSPVAIGHSGKEKDGAEPGETPLDDSRQRTDWPNTKQTDEPWKGNPEKDQLDPKRPDIDPEKWQESNTH